MFRSLTLSVVAALLVSAPVFADALDEASDQIRTAWDSHKSMRAVMRVEAGTPTGSSRIITFGEGPMLMLRAEGVERYKSALRMEFANPMNATMQVETVFDGKTIQVTNDSLGRRTTREATQGVLKGSVPPGGAALLDALAKDAKLSRAEDGVSDGVEAFVLDGQPEKTEGASAAVARLRAYIAKETGALLKLELYETDSVLTAKIMQRDFEWDVELEPTALEPGSPATTPASAPAAK
jgi:hypothetical protein